MKCKDCVYCWQDDDDDFPQCHFDGDFGGQPTAPCEFEDDEEAYEDIDRREREWLDEHEGYQE